MIWGLSLCAVLALAGVLNFMQKQPEPGEGFTHIYIPPRQKATKKAPTLILLHGVGSNERDLTTLAETLDPRFAIYSLRAPLTIGQNQFSWFHVSFTNQGPIHDRSQAESSRLLLKKFLENLGKNPEVDSSQIFLLGFSQGAIMSLSLALTEPALVKGIIPIAGRTLQEISAQAKERSFAAKPKVLLLHGLEDKRLPIFHGVASEAVLKEAKFDYQFRTYKAGHEITAAMIEDIQTWLTANISGPQ